MCPPSAEAVGMEEHGGIFVDAVTEGRRSTLPLQSWTEGCGLATQGLSAWLVRVQRSVLLALTVLDRLPPWRARAGAADLSVLTYSVAAVRRASAHVMIAVS